MSEFFSRTFYGNTMAQWAISLAIMLGAVLVGKVLYFITSRVVRKMTAKTRTKLDDIFVDMVEEPLVVAVTVAGLWFGLSRLNMPTKVEEFAGSTVQVVIILSLVWLVSRLIDAMFREYLVPLAEKSRTDLDDQLLPLARKGCKIMVWTIGIVLALNNAGYNVGALIAGLGIGGLALAMAAQDTVANVFGGFTIFTDKPFSINDRVKISGFDGTVTEIGVRSTRIRTLEGRLVTIPNRIFSDSAVENVSAEPSRKVILELGLTYDTTPDRMRAAMDILREIAATGDGVEENVIIGFTGFGDSAMVITFIYYITSGEDIMAVKSATNLAILERFNKEGLEFAYPTQMLYTQALKQAS